jgi:indolepyruvate ferredoxin oxidoreductase alpha subunit
MFKQHIQVDAEVCVLCGRCVELCPRNALGADTEGIVVDDALCVGCLLCEMRCPMQAISHINQRLF